MFKRTKKITMKKIKKRLEKLQLFDAVYYLKNNKEARLASEIPIDHYCKVGVYEGLDPNPQFDSQWYKEFYEDVAENGAPALIHYLFFGHKENRFQNIQEKEEYEKLKRDNFDTEYYISNYEDLQSIEDDNFNFILHYIRSGKHENRIYKNEKAKYDTVIDLESYLSANPDIEKMIADSVFKSAKEHFQKTGYTELQEGKRRLGLEFPYYNQEQYLDLNTDVADSIDSGNPHSAFDHFLTYGHIEFQTQKRRLGGHYPFTLTDDLKKELQAVFDEEKYIESNSDIKEALEKGSIESGWEHFINNGIWEIRDGRRSISEIAAISESEYVYLFEDIKEALKSKAIISPFEHFLLSGQFEIANGSRKIKKSKEYTYSDPTLDTSTIQELNTFAKKPLISIIMPVYNVAPKWLDSAIKSIEKQWYTNWEICIADDKSTNKETLEYLQNLKHPKIKILFLDKNQNISGASNEALKISNGEYIALMDNDDELTPDALFEVVKAINTSGAEFIYSDEDKLEMDGSYSDPHFKPDYAPDMFMSQNYMSHLGVIKKELITSVGGWEKGVEGAQDFDLYLKVLEHTDRVVHIDKVLYHWRKIPGSTAAEFSDKSYAQDAGKIALKNALKRRGVSGEVLNAKYPGTYRVKYKTKNNPLVSIIIPFKDKPELLDMCVNSILEKSTYKNYEIIGISNNSDEKETFEMMRTLESQDKRVSFYEYNVPFNYSKINNHAVKEYAKGAHILLLNNDIEIITPDWIESMLEFSQREDVGCVGAKLYYPNDTIQHAGVIIGLGSVAGHSHKHFEQKATGYFSRLNIVQNLSAVTAACLMVKKEIYEAVDGLNEESLKIAFNDVDFCLRVLEKNYLNVFTPYCEAYHHESVSRGFEDNPEKVARFTKEIQYIQERHAEILKNGDRYYNRNLTLAFENFGIK